MLGIFFAKHYNLSGSLVTENNENILLKIVMRTHQWFPGATHRCMFSMCC